MFHWRPGRFPSSTVPPSTSSDSKLLSRNDSMTDDYNGLTNGSGKKKYNSNKHGHQQRPHSADITKRMTRSSSMAQDIRPSASLQKDRPLPSRFQVLPMHVVRTWPEYKLLRAGDVLLTIEHCCNCHQHDSFTHHNEERYLSVKNLFCGNS